LPGFGIRISVRISPGLRLVSNRPTNRSSIAIVRVPAAPRATTWAPYASMVAG